MPTPPAAKPGPTGLTRLPFDPRAVPAALVHTGTIAGGMRWRDKSGENWLLLSRLIAYGADSRSAYLFADHYVIAKGARRRLVVAVRDHLDRCQFDLVARFVPASFDVTDLDGDGIGEVTFAYELGCRTGVSPIPLKLLTLEGGDKYIIRGNTRVDESPSVHLGGARTIDASFARGPKPFLAHADKLWAAIVRERP